MLFPLSPTPTPTPSVTYEPQIPEFAGSWPTWAQWAVGVPLQIVLIITIGLLILAVVRRLVRSWTDSIATGTPWAHRRLGRKFAKTEVGAVLADASPLSTARRKQRSRTIGSVTSSTLTAVVGTVVVVMVLDTLGVPIGPIIASAGIVGVAVGFGAQSLVKDVLAGLFMLVEDQYGVGDTVDVGPAVGRVEKVGLRVTRIRDSSGALWFVPNGSINRVANKTQGWTQAVVDLRLPYSADTAAAEQVLATVVSTMYAEPAWHDALVDGVATTGIESLTGDAVLLRLVVRTRPSRQSDVAHELRERVKTALEQAGIELATTPMVTVRPDAQ